MNGSDRGQVTNTLTYNTLEMMTNWDILISESQFKNNAFFLDSYVVFCFFKYFYVLHVAKFAHILLSVTASLYRNK